MAFRSLTDIFILMRNNSIQSRQTFNDNIPDISSDRVALIGKKHLVIEEDIELGGICTDEEGICERDKIVAPPPWIDDLFDIRYNHTLINQNIKQLEQLQDNQLQRPTFDDDNSNEKEIQIITSNITRLFGTCYKLIQQIQSKGSRSCWSEKRLRDNVIKSTISSLQDLSQTFRSSQGKYLRKITAREEMSNRYFDLIEKYDTNQTFNYDETFLESRNVEKGDNGWTQQQLLALEDDNLHLIEREEEVENIVKSIIDLNGIFRDLSNMVSEQSDVIDRIDYTVETTHVKVSEGVKHLQKAATYQKRNRKCIFFVTAVFLTIILIILLVAFGT